MDTGALFSRVSPDRRPLPALAFAFSIFAGIVAADVATGTELSLAPFYLLLVLAVTWYAGAAAGWLFAGLSTAALLAVGMALGHPYSHPGYYAIDVAGKLLAMAITVMLASRLARAHDHEYQVARTDLLTGLPNRAMFQQALDLELARLRRYGRPFALVCIDCDNFKSVNDKDGHGAGDELLRAVAGALSGALRRTDVYARLGGDEFAMLLPETDAATCGIVVDQLRERLLEVMTAKGWPVTFSMGAAIFTRPVPKLQDALARADELMYRVKRRGKNGLLIETDGRRQREPAEAAA